MSLDGASGPTLHGEIKYYRPGILAYAEVCWITSVVMQMMGSYFIPCHASTLAEFKRALLRGLSGIQGLTIACLF